MVGEELEQRGYAVTRQTVTGERVNLLATVGTPEVIFSTHMDCVPPFTPSRVEGDRIHGRGSCDAKGILVSQMAAVEAMRAAGETRVGLLFLVGEERGSDGAMIADELSTGVTRFLVNGEPTEGRLALGHRGVVRVKLHAKGRAAHSGYPHLGESAIEKLLDALQQVRAMALPIDAVLGPTQVNIGAISGGLAPNVDSARRHRPISSSASSRPTRRCWRRSSRFAPSSTSSTSTTCRRCTWRRSTASKRKWLVTRPMRRCSTPGARA